MHLPQSRAAPSWRTQLLRAASALLPTPGVPYAAGAVQNLDPNSPMVLNFQHRRNADCRAVGSKLPVTATDMAR